MKRPIRFAQSRALVATLSALGSAAAFAQQVNPTDVVLQRLKQTAAKETSDGYKLTAVKLKGDINTDGIKFTLPTVVPEKPLVLLQQRIANCNDREVLGRSTVNKSTENSESFSKSSTLGGETTVSVSYESPIGLGGSASQSFNYSKTTTEEKTYTETVGWDQGIDVPVGPKQALTVQFVVAEQKLDNIPWSTNVIVSGPAEMTYTRAPGSVTVCAHEHTSYGGKKKCWTTSSTKKIRRFKDEKWDSGKGNINDEVTAISIKGHAKVTVYKHKDYDGWSKVYTSSVANVGKGANDKFSSMVIEPLGSTKTLTQNVEKYLNDAQRRIALSGKYKGVNGVQGDFRAGAPVTLLDSDCGLVSASAKSTAPAPSAMRTAPSAAKAPAAPRAAMVQTAAVAPNAAPLQGKILASGIKPAKRTVVKSSVKK
jgi:hypothetical protein